MCVKTKSAMRAAALLPVLLLAACAATETQPAAVSEMFKTPEWAKPTQVRTSQTRAITQADLINADGSCAMPASTDGAASPSPDADPSAGQGQMPLAAGGVGLGMSECEVLQRTGAPSTFNIGSEGTSRVVTLTVTQGPSPGLYRFRDGRLVTMERVEVPPPPRTAKSTRPKKSAAPAQPQRQPTPLRGAQQ